MISLLSLTAAALIAPPIQKQPLPEPGQMTIIDRDGKPGLLVPLEKTTVHADVAGLGARVTLKQTFKNPSNTPIEAVYTFPMPADAAVDRMRMIIGDRLVEGEIKRREEARQIYEAAKRAGQAASLLDQERPNIFTQNVANIMPGAKIEVEISYVQTVKYEDGEFEFSFPMVVGPRFIPPTTDGSKVTPPTLPPGKRTGTTIDLSVSIHDGKNIQGMKAVSHAISFGPSADTKDMNVKLTRADEIPNKDFILRWNLKSGNLGTTFLTDVRPGKGGTFRLFLLPPKPENVAKDVSPKEVMFVMDQSGSQSGFPLEKSKELTLGLIKKLHTGDTFNVMSFGNSPVLLWPEPKPFNRDNLAAAENFIRPLQANGGTMFVPAVEAAMNRPAKDGRIKLVVFNTDGYVGNDFEVLKLVAKYRNNARMFTFGIGNAVNRFLIDAMSRQGRGDSETVTLGEKAEGAIDRFIQRTESPLLTEIYVKVDGVPVKDMTPTYVPDVFSEKPVMIYGRYLAPGHGKITISGRLGGKPWTKTIEADFPSVATGNSAISTLWARNKVADIEDNEYLNAAEVKTAELDANGQPKNDLITQIGLEYGIMTRSTSFVAVEKRIINVGGKQRTVAVPIDMPEGVTMGANSADRAGLALGAPGSPTGGGRGSGGGGYGGAAGSIAKPAKSTADEKLKNADPSMTKEEKAQLKISKKLNGKTGEVEVQIRLADLSDKVLKALKDAGFILDDQDKNLKVAFGRIKSESLKKLAMLDDVLAIDPL